MIPPGRLTAIIPTLDEATHLPRLLLDLNGTGIAVVVADGGSGDGTVEAARRSGARVVRSQRGRAAQLRAGAAVAETPWLFFVHADSRLPDGCLSELASFVESAPADEFAHFRFALDGPRPFHRFIELGQRIRERASGLVYGDQGLVVSRTLYDAVGGYPEWPLLEDVGMVEALGRVGCRNALRTALPTSPRRYDSDGGVRQWLRHSAIIALYRLGVPPEGLAARFPRRPPRRPTRSPSGDSMIIVFAKAPRPGWVKTRLAADVGAAEAVRIYRALGRATVDALRPHPARLVVYYAPDEDSARAEVAAWLGSDAEYRPQTGGDLGERMERALGQCLEEAERVCIVGTDIPGLGADEVSGAFAALSGSDVAIGPATDGGYYLMALRRPLPGLFRDVPWSTQRVLEATLDRAAELDVTVELLDPKTDVDTIADVPAALRTA